MGWWTNTRWAHDEDELRTYYYIEAGPGGLSRLECYRRLLAHSDRRMPRALSVGSQRCACCSDCWASCSASTRC